MNLEGKIEGLRDRVLMELNAAHDYYLDTSIAWVLVEKMVESGFRFTIRNRATGSTTSQVELVSKAIGYIDKQLAEAVFIQFLSQFEIFVVDLLRLWLVEYPRSLGNKQISFKQILDSVDKDAIVVLMVDKEINELLYERPTTWFEYLEEKLKIDPPRSDAIERIAEAKATRDVIVHNRGIVNKIYEIKSGRFARFKNGDAIEINEKYHRDTWDLIREIVAEISGAAIRKITKQN